MKRLLQRNTLILFFLALLNALLASYGLNIAQENPHELFFSDENAQQYHWMQMTFPASDFIFAHNDDQKIVSKIKDEYLETVEVSTGSLILAMPKMSDQEKFFYFQDFQKKYPATAIAGESFTTAHLTGMSLKIQKFLFPLCFLTIFIGLMIAFRNFYSAIFIFLSVLLGVTGGFSVIRLFYAHATLLTTLAPLLCFILNLGALLHMIYGFKIYQEKRLFLKKKALPIILMMGTTLIGILGLWQSQLIIIRQFALVTSLTLLSCWAIFWLLFMVITPKFTLFIFNKNALVSVKRKRSLPPVVAIVGALLAVVLGATLIERFPIQVEALYFFPENHELRIGHDIISRELGGTPQFDFFIEKKDKNSSWDYEDTKILCAFEEQLGSLLERDNIKLMSPCQLVLKASLEYTKSPSFPDNIFAFQTLEAFIPKILWNFFQADKVYRLSWLGRALNLEERQHFLKLWEDYSVKNPIFSEHYLWRVGGGAHLLNLSQQNLVREMLYCFLWSFLFIIISYSIFSRHLVSILTFTTINFSSIMASLAVMAFTGPGFNVSSVMTMSMSLGLLVDSTIHLLYADRQGQDQAHRYQTILFPIILTHILLIIPFGLFLFEDFLPIHDFAKSLLIYLLVGLFFDLYVLDGVRTFFENVFSRDVQKEGVSWVKK